MNSLAFPRHLPTLMAKLVEGSLTTEEIEQLRTFLNENSDAQSYYCQYLDLHEELLQRSGLAISSPIASTATVPQLSVPISSLRVRVLSFGVIAAAFYGVFIAIAWNLRPEKLPTAIAKDSSVAVVRNVSDVQWSKKGAAKAASSAILLGEPLRIDAGTIELELATGTKLIVEGPADWSVDGENHTTLHSGKLLATVPPRAIGFTVDTPGGQVVDRGTEFGLQADADGRTEVHVFRGSVDWQPSHGKQGIMSVGHPRRLVAGEAITIEPATNDEQNTKADTSKFARAFAFPPGHLMATPKKLPALPELPIRDTLLLWLDANAILHANEANPASGEVLTRWANQANTTDDGMVSDALPIGSTASPKYLSRTATRLAGVRFTGDQEQGQCLQAIFREPLLPPYTIFVTAIVLGNSATNATDFLFDSPEPLTTRVAMGVNPTGRAHDSLFFIPGQLPAVSVVWKQKQWQTWRLYETVCHSDSVEFFVNGRLMATQATTVASLSKLWFGSRCNGEHFLNGVLSEVLVYGSALPPEQRAAVEQYSFRKWGLVD